MKRDHIVFILGGGILEENGAWRTTTFSEEGDAFGALGDRLRVEAAVILYKALPETTLIVPSGSKGQLKNHPTAPTIARVIAGELQVMGVPVEAIMLDEISSNSYQQVCTLKQLAERHNWQSIKVLTNQWHLKRVQTMIDITDSLKMFFKERNITLIAAETILIEAKKDQWQAYVDEAYESDAMKAREEKEAQGVQDLLSGTYTLR